MPAIPFLFIEGHGPSDPVLYSGPMSTQFIYDDKVRAHVHRFESLEDFRTRSKEIIHHERMWKLFPGIDDEPVEEDDDVTDELDDLRLQLAAIQALAEFEPGITISNLPDNVTKSRAVSAVYRLLGTLDDAQSRISHLLSPPKATAPKAAAPKVAAKPAPAKATPPNSAPKRRR